MSRSMPRDQKARIFKDQTAKLLTRPESDVVKAALGAFIKSKDTPTLVDTLKGELTTPAKAAMFDAVALFIPDAQFAEYDELSAPFRPDTADNGSAAAIAMLNLAEQVATGPGSAPTDTDTDANTPGPLLSRRGSMMSRPGLVRRASASVTDAFNPRQYTLADTLRLRERGAGQEANGKIVLYTTSGGGIAETKILCAKMRLAFQLLRVSFEDRNVNMSKEFAAELAARLPGGTVPQCFWNGEHLGDYDKVLSLNETGKLAKMVAGMAKKELMQSGECTACGGEGFMICHDCGGDKKALRLRYGKATSSAQVHHDLKCTKCNENGLVSCAMCMG